MLHRNDLQENRTDVNFLSNSLLVVDGSVFAELAQTFISKREPAHLWELLEWLQADGTTINFKPNYGNLVLFDESWSLAL